MKTSRAGNSVDRPPAETAQPGRIPGHVVTDTMQATPHEGSEQAVRKRNALRRHSHHNVRAAPALLYNVQDAGDGVAFCREQHDKIPDRIFKRGSQRDIVIDPERELDESNGCDARQQGSDYVLRTIRRALVQHNDLVVDEIWVEKALELAQPLGDGRRLVFGHEYNGDKRFVLW